MKNAFEIVHVVSPSLYNFTSLFFFLAEPVAGSPRELDLFGQSLVGDLWDMPASVPNENPSVNSASSNVDLFANAPLASAPSNVQAGTSFQVLVICYSACTFLSPTKYGRKCMLVTISDCRIQALRN